MKTLSKIEYPLGRFVGSETHTMERSRATYLLRAARSRGRKIERRAGGYFFTDCNFVLITRIAVNSMKRAKQFDLAMSGESFALVGEQDKSPRCSDCGKITLLVAGRCEACQGERNSAIREQEATQETFF